MYFDVEEIQALLVVCRFVLSDVNLSATIYMYI